MIRVIYTEEPNFPATDQHPEAVRYQVGGYFVDATEEEPTQDDIDAFLSPAPTPKEATMNQVRAALFNIGLTDSQIDKFLIEASKL